MHGCHDCTLAKVNSWRQCCGNAAERGQVTLTSHSADRQQKRKQSVNLQYNSVFIRHTSRLQSSASPTHCMMNTSSSFNRAACISHSAGIYGNVIKGDETTINKQIALLSARTQEIIFSPYFPIGLSISKETVKYRPKDTTAV